MTAGPYTLDQRASLESQGSISIRSISQEQVEHIRKHINPKFAQCDEETIKRFIKATGGNLPLSTKRLNTTLAWREQVKPEQMVCRACAKQPNSHYMHVVGHDLLGRPIIYSCLALANNRVFEDNSEHMIQTFETAIKCMPPGVDQWIWVCDFHGFGTRDLSPKLAKAFLDISAEHYPERLGLFLVVDAPSLFGVLWRAISPFVDPKTYKKIRFLPYDPKKGSKSLMIADFNATFDAETSNWFVKELEGNRDKKLLPTKVYDASAIYQQAQQGCLCPSCDKISPTTSVSGSSTGTHVDEAGVPKATVAVMKPQGHDFRGTPKLLSVYQVAPEILLPQGAARA